MLDEFAELLGQVFPSVEPDTARRFIQATKAGRALPSDLYSPIVLNGVCQADILGPLRFHTIETDGDSATADGFGLILSNSCDVEHDELVVASYGYTLSDLEASPSAELRTLCRDAQRNTINNLLYLPSIPEAGNVVFDLSWLGTFSSEFVATSIASGAVQRYASLSQLGFYLFLAKLTVHFLRPETGVSRPPLGTLSVLDRLLLAARIVRG